jgi:hypothetical protein
MTLSLIDVCDSVNRRILSSAGLLSLVSVTLMVVFKHSCVLYILQAYLSPSL